MGHGVPQRLSGRALALLVMAPHQRKRWPTCVMGSWRCWLRSALLMRWRWKLPDDGGIAGAAIRAFRNVLVIVSMTEDDFLSLL